MYFLFECYCLVSINILIVGKNIQYYNNNAQEFYSRTINADLSDNYKAFTSYLPEQAHILDAGCGVGRDTKYFLSQRYQVTAFDGSTEMVK
ncbi:class I SAM-dependent methyltransferase [Rickettsia peacockii]|uniref:class I SAM-dependent methyltransferase n=1 Tax=Rickettsia peacockii TaxID=47589 RepID=UPI000A10E28A|nr:class I SAM-dependent methyltransferase [Rickettsia peacockii]